MKNILLYKDSGSVALFVEEALKQVGKDSRLTLTIGLTPQGDYSVECAIEGLDGTSLPNGLDPQQTISKIPLCPKCGNPPDSPGIEITGGDALSGPFGDPCEDFFHPEMKERYG
jgi:hypothetical protein